MLESSKTFESLMSDNTVEENSLYPDTSYPSGSYGNNNEIYGLYGNDITYENYLQDFYNEYEDYFSSLYGNFDGIVKKGVSVYQIIAFYGEPTRYAETASTMTLYYNDSYIVCNSLGIVIDFFNNGYFLTEETENPNNN